MNCPSPSRTFSACFAVSLMYLLLCTAQQVTGKTIVVNSTSSVSNGLQPGEITLPYAIWLTSGAFIERDRPECFGPDSIHFDIDPQFAGGQTEGPYELQITQGIQIYDEVHIDGFTQPGASVGNPMIYISGNDNDVFQFSGHRDFGDASGSSLRGTGIINAKSFAIYISSITDITIEDNYIGVNSDGSVNAGMDKGMTIVDGASNLTIRNNVVSGARGNAIEIQPGTNQLTQQFDTPHDIVLSGNMIGTDITGTISTTAYGSGGSGIKIANGENIEITNNVIGNNSLNPIDNFSTKDAVNIGNSSNVTISGNFIGVGADGTTNMANGDNGISVWSSGDGGGDVTIVNNHIANNGGHGVEISGAQNTNVIVGNNGSSDDPAAGNEIHHNGGHGVIVTDFGGGAGTQDPIRINSIYCNGDGGISTDGGGNSGIAEPVIDTDASTATRLLGTAPAGSTVDLYQVGPDCYTCGNDDFTERQGRVYLGSTTADGSGNWIFDCGSGLYQGVTATATDGSNNTSQFSNIYNVNCETPPLEPEVALAADPEEFCEGGTTDLTATPTNGGDNPTFIFYVNGVEVCSGTSNTCTPDASAFTGPRDIVEVVMIQDNDFCYELRTDDFVWVTIIPGLPPPDAGDDATICAGQTHALSGTAEGYDVFSWSTSGDGVFSSETVEDPTYTPGDQDIENGEVVLTLTGVGGCNSDGDEMTLTIGAAPEPALDDVQLCSGGTTTLDPGTDPGLDHAWATGENSATLDVTQSGTYTVTVTDPEGCYDQATAEVTISDAMDITLTTDFDPCSGTPTATIDLEFTGGQAPFTFEWSDGDNSDDATDRSALPAGNYAVSITDANDCQSVATITVEQGSGVVAEAALVDSVSRYELSDGAITSSGTGGSTPYAFLWSTGDATTDVSGLPEGWYYVTITDDNDCEDSASVYVPQPEPLGLEIEGDILTPCPGDCTNDLDVIASGGVPPYSYEWFDGSNGTSVADLCAGVWGVTVTDAKGATAAGDFTIAEPPHLTATTTSTEASCDGAADGTVGVTAGGGTPDYSYTWNGDFGAGSNPGNSASGSAVPAGQYEVTVIDDNGCTLTETVNVDEATAMTLTHTSINVSCFNLSDGSIDVTASGGPTPYDFSWDSGQAAEDLTDIPAGTYELTAVDADGCTRRLTVDITEPEILSGTITDTDVACFGDTDGRLDLEVTGGTPDYTYLWNDNSVSQNLTSLGAGNYGVTVTDANGCTTSLNAAIEQPEALALSSQVTDILCAGETNGAIVINVAGGTPAYDYQWNASGSAGQITELPAGDYSVTITDDGQCSEVEHFTVTEPTQMTVIVATVDASCYGDDNGAAFLTVLNGTPDYTFTWTNGSDQEDLQGVQAGNYAVVITDDNGCELTQNVTIEEPDLVLVTADATSNLICPGTQAELSATATGGSGDYSFLWDDPNNGQNPTLNQTDVANPTAEPTATTTYYVVAFDENGCPSNLADVTIDIAVPVNLDVAADDYAICQGQEITLSHLAGGSDRNFHDYAWSTSTAILSANDVVMTTPSETTTYYATVTDNCNTQDVDSLTIVVTPTPQPVITTEHLPECDDILVSMTNGDTTNVGGDCEWTFGDGTTSSISCDSLTHLYLQAGTFSITLTHTSNEGCVGSDQVERTFDYAPHPVASFSPDKYEREVPDVTWEFENASVGATSYLWDFGDGSELDSTAQPIHAYDEEAPGKYNVTLIVENQYGCTDTTAEEISLRGIYTLFAPNAFTPDGDNKNDYWLPRGIGLNDMTYMIFDRWGDLIYESTHELDFWDGTFKQTGEPVKQDVYTWKISAYSEWADGEISQTGKVTVLR